MAGYGWDNGSLLFFFRETTQPGKKMFRRTRETVVRYRTCIRGIKLGKRCIIATELGKATTRTAMQSCE